MDKVDNSANRHIFDHSGAVIGLFAKQPVPGQVKTRLTPPLTAEQACQLYRTALQESFSRLLNTAAAIAICYAGERSWFQATFPGVPLFAQQGEGLGARMRNAVADLFAAAGGPVLLAGAIVGWVAWVAGRRRPWHLLPALVFGALTLFVALIGCFARLVRGTRRTPY